MAIGIKQAVDAAKRFCIDAFQTEKGILLEEIESKDNKWLITLSFRRDDDSSIANALQQYRRSYKVFAVNQETAEVESVKIRQLNDQAA